MKYDPHPEVFSPDDISTHDDAGKSGDCHGQSPDAQKPIIQMPAETRKRRTIPGNTSATDWAHAVAMLRSTQRMVIIVVARHSDRYGVSWCKQKTLAVESGCSDRTVRRLLKEFEHRGLIRRVGRLGSHGAQVSDLVIIVGWPERKLIPDTGHPNPKIALKETRETRFLWSVNRAQARTQFPGGGGNSARPEQRHYKYYYYGSARRDSDGLLRGAWGIGYCREQAKPGGRSPNSAIVAQQRH